MSVSLKESKLDDLRKQFQDLTGYVGYTSTLEQWAEDTGNKDLIESIANQTGGYTRTKIFWYTLVSVLEADPVTEPSELAQSAKEQLEQYESPSFKRGSYVMCALALMLRVDLLQVFIETYVIPYLKRQKSRQAKKLRNQISKVVNKWIGVYAHHVLPWFKPHNTYMWIEKRIPW